MRNLVSDFQIFWSFLCLSYGAIQEKYSHRYRGWGCSQVYFTLLSLFSLVVVLILLCILLQCTHFYDLPHCPFSCPPPLFFLNEAKYIKYFLVAIQVIWVLFIFFSLFFFKIIISTPLGLYC